MGDAVPDEDLPGNEVPEHDLPDINQPDDTSVPEFTDKTKTVLGGTAQLVGSTIANIPHAAAHGAVDLYRSLTGGNLDAADPAIVRAIEVPTGEHGKKLMRDIGEALPHGGKQYNPATEGGPYLSPGTTPADARDSDPNAEISLDVLRHAARVAGDIGAIAPASGMTAKLIPSMRNAVMASRAAAQPSAVIPKTFTPEEAVANTTASGSMGAAAAAPDISTAHPELKTAISQAAQRTGGAVHPIALERHLDTYQLPLPEGTEPIRLRKGQATGDAQQISDEKNLRADPDTHGILTESITDQDNKLGSSMGEIRRRATPDIVQRTNREHGQASVDAIKDQDNKTVLDIRDKYKALTDANGGAVPIDTGAAINNIDAQLKKGYLTKTAQSNGVVSSVMEDLRSGNHIDFESFENARTRLADVQRGGGPDGVAAGIVRNELENMPLSADASHLKDLANTARAAAKSRFDTISANPAYEAAINDNTPKVKGLHVIGAESPLADSFMDRYALGNGQTASRAYVQRLKDAVPDPIISQSIEAATLNKLRDAAGIDAFGNGSFRNASYRNAHTALAKKSDALLSPESIENTERLKRISGYVNDEGKASSVNRSNTAVTLQRHGAQFPSDPTVAGQVADYGADVVAGHLGPVAVVGKNVGQSLFKKSQEAKALKSQRDAKLKFAIDATKPGAGLDHLEATKPKRVGRASGGKVDHEELVQKLINRWKDAKKATDATTKPLLGVSDAAIVRALDIAGNAL